MIYCRIEFHIAVFSGRLIAVIEQTAEENYLSVVMFFLQYTNFTRLNVAEFSDACGHATFQNVKESSAIAIVFVPILKES